MVKPNLACRMYEAKFPKERTVVMVQVKGVAEFGAWVSLVEYNNMEGMIFFTDETEETEVSKRPKRRQRCRPVSPLFKCHHATSGLAAADQAEPAMVVRVNREKKCVYLSKRTMSEEDVKACQMRYHMSMLVHFVLCRVAETLSIDLKHLYATVGWPLYRKYGHAYNAFTLIVINPDYILDSLTKEIREVGPDGVEETKVVPAVTKEMKDALVKHIRDFIEVMKAYGILLTDDDTKEIKTIKDQFCAQFEKKDLEATKRIFKVVMNRIGEKLFVSQKDFVEKVDKVLSRFHVKDVKPVLILPLVAKFKFLKRLSSKRKEKTKEQSS